MLLLRAARITSLVAGRRADSLTYMRQAAELRASHLDVAALNAELTKPEVRTRAALARRCRSRCYSMITLTKGVRLGAAAAVLLKLFIFH